MAPVLKAGVASTTGGSNPSLSANWKGNPMGDGDRLEPD